MKRTELQTATVIILENTMTTETNIVESTMEEDSQMEDSQPVSVNNGTQELDTTMSEPMQEDDLEHGGHHNGRHDGVGNHIDGNHGDGNHGDGDHGDDHGDGHGVGNHTDGNHGDGDHGDGGHGDDHHGGDGDHGDGDYGDSNHGGDSDNDKGFPCNDCEKTFRTKWTLKYHQRVHTGEKPYLCLTCGRQFRQPSHLKIHQRVHSGERPYVCEDCGRAFIDSSTMRRHARLHKDLPELQEEVAQDPSGDEVPEEVHRDDGVTVGGECIEMAGSSNDESARSSQPISTNVMHDINQSEVNLVEGAVPDDRVAEIALSSWQQNSAAGNLEEQIAYLFPSTKETNKEQNANTSENMTF